MDLTWSKGKLASMRKGAPKTGTRSHLFTYNGFGQRVSKRYTRMLGISEQSHPDDLGESIQQYYYDHSGRLIAETCSKEYFDKSKESYRIVYLYDESSIIGMMYTMNGTTNRYYFQRNLLGDVVGIFDTSGGLVARYLYDAWGNCTIAGDTTNNALAHANPIRYRGYYYDDDTGLYYLNARYYSPKWRRFISPDDTAYLDPDNVNGLNLYCYCNNDPVNVASNIPTETNNVKSLAVSTALNKPTCHEIRKSVSHFSLPKSNYVMMTHRTTSLLENAFWGGFLGNISYTVTTQWNESEASYSYVNVGNSGVSRGVGRNWGSWYGRSAYISSNIGAGSSTQLTPWFTYGSELSVLDGITLSAGIISGNKTHEISVNIGWGGMLGAYAVATVIAATPVPGARALAGVAVCVILFVDMFN